MNNTNQDFEKVLESLITVDKYCHEIGCGDCPFFYMEGEGECPLDKLGLGERSYMEEVKEKAKKRIEAYKKDFERERMEKQLNETDNDS